MEPPQPSGDPVEEVVVHQSGVTVEEVGMNMKIGRLAPSISHVVLNVSALML